MRTVTTQVDQFSRTLVFVDGKLVGRVLPRNCGTWAASKTGEDVGYYDTRKAAIAALAS